MQLLRDNLTLWTSDMQADGDGEQKEQIQDVEDHDVLIKFIKTERECFVCSSTFDNSTRCMIFSHFPPVFHELRYLQLCRFQYSEGEKEFLLDHDKNANDCQKDKK
uniref:Uncharacterized protein n=1 Tax=Glossina pallidipes TaxID=7398 RepID=A0A1A9ZW68_GLOPL